MSATIDPARTETIARHLATDYARDKVARALHDVLLDGLEFGPCDLPKPEDREWIRAAMAVPVREVTEAAIQLLARRVTEALEAAPNDLLVRFEESHRWNGMG
jgi:hypothetical protein